MCYLRYQTGVFGRVLHIFLKGAATIVKCSMRGVVCDTVSWVDAYLGLKMPALGNFDGDGGRSMRRRLGYLVSCARNSQFAGSNFERFGKEEGRSVRVGMCKF